MWKLYQRIPDSFFLKWNLHKSEVEVDAIFHDLSKAFDKVSHDQLVQKLKTIGIEGKLNHLFKTY